MPTFLEKYFYDEKAARNSASLHVATEFVGAGAKVELPIVQMQHEEQSLGGAGHIIECHAPKMDGWYICTYMLYLYVASFGI